MLPYEPLWFSRTSLYVVRQVCNRSACTCVGNQYAVVLQRTLTSYYSTEAAAPPAKVSQAELGFIVSLN